MVHHMQILAKGNKLFLSPLSSPPKRILDVGTGYVHSSPAKGFASPR